MSLQTGGTCWFHADINSMLKSSGGITLLKLALIRYKATLTTDLKATFNSNRNNTFNPRDSKFNFYKWLDRWLTQGRRVDVCSRRLIQQILPEFRNNAITTNGNYPTQHFLTFLKRIGLSDSTNIRTNGNNLSNLRRELLVIPIYPEIKTTMPNKINNYNISFAVIGISLPISGQHSNHAIAGVVIKGAYYIIDSNRPTSIIACDWRNTDNILTNPRYRLLCNELYNSTPVLTWIYHACYVRQTSTGVTRKRNSNILNVKVNKTHNKERPRKFLITNNNGTSPMNTNNNNNNGTRPMNTNNSNRRI